MCLFLAGHPCHFIMDTDVNDSTSPSGVRKRININRPAYSEEEFQQTYQETTKEPPSVPKLLRKKLSSCTCTKKDLKNIITGFFPVLKWLPEYDVKSQLVGDVMSGFTVGILRLPQGKFDFSFIW